MFLGTYKYMMRCLCTVKRNVPEIIMQSKLGSESSVENLLARNIGSLLKDRLQQ